MDSEERNIVVSKMNGVIAHQLGMLDRARRDGFHPVTWTKLGDRVRAESTYWQTAIFAPGRAPMNLPEVRYNARASTSDSDDILQIEWSAADLQIVAFETTAMFAVWVAKSPAAANPSLTAIGAELRRIGSALFSQPLDFRERSPSEQEQRVAFSTAPEARIFIMPSWTSRIDAGIHDGHLHFLFYKRKSQLAGFEDGSHWFEENLR